jgi:hypothetical protein
MAGLARRHEACSWRLRPVDPAARTGLEERSMRDVRRTVTSIPVGLLIAATASLLTGCATGRIVWDKPGVTQAERERDENTCLRAAIGTDSRGQLLVAYCFDRDIYTRCMEGRGYTAQPK